MAETNYQHNLLIFSRSNKHVTQNTGFFPQIKEGNTVFQSVFFNEKPYRIRWFTLQVTVLDIKYFIKELAYVETESDALLIREIFGVFVWKDPPSFGSGELEFIAIFSNL